MAALYRTGARGRGQLTVRATIRRPRGTAAELHELEFPESPGAPGAEIWVMEPTGRSVVMGSSQRPDHFDRDALAISGVQLGSRRSGGGAVYIEPETTLWIDILAPRGSPWWSDDLTETFVGVGRAWQRALGDLGLHLDLAFGGPSHEHSRWACWAGLGWGELAPPGRIRRLADGPGPVDKIVGLSQRRTRWGARIQSMAMLDASADRIADWFSAPDAPDPGALRSRIGSRPLLVEAGIGRDRLEAVVLDRLIAGP